MHRIILSLALASVLSSCGDGQPLFGDEIAVQADPNGSTASGDNGSNGSDNSLSTDGGTPPDTAEPNGTTEPTSQSSIYRYEAENNTSGSGHATSFSYNNSSGQDELTITGLAFDGTDIYSRGATVSSLNGYSVYDADITVPDFLTGDAVYQVAPYRAILGLSNNSENGKPRTSFAIVRTGGYVGYGFGGFIYQRESGVVIPSSGFAVYKGDYSGMRVFDGSGGLEYTTGDMTLNFDFAGFGNGAAVYGSIINRNAYDQNGNPITIDSDTSDGICDNCLILPNIRWTIQAGNSVLDENGEISGDVFSLYSDQNGDIQNYENGQFYAILAGDATDAADGGEVVGVVVITSNDPRLEENVQETGGFILYRSDD